MPTDAKETRPAGDAGSACELHSMHLRFVRLLPLVLITFVAGHPTRCEGRVPPLRVGLLVHRERVAFSGGAGLKVYAGRGRRLPPLSAPAGETWQARREGREIVVSDSRGAEVARARRRLRILPAAGGTVTILDVPGHWDKRTTRAYRGMIEIRTDRSGGLTVVNIVDIETYLRGVVPSEMPANYPLEALKAQAVAARGQALIKAGRHRRQGFDLCATQHCQVYGGATSEDPRTDRAVAETRGEVLTYHGRLADTLYSSTCGGHTANNEDYWPDQRPVPYLRGVPDFEPEDGVDLSFPLAGDQLKRYLKYAPRVNCYQSRYAASDKIRWWETVKRAEMKRRLAEALGDFGDLLDLRVAGRADCGMVEKLAVIGSRKLVTVEGGRRIRSLLGLQSATFAIESYRERPSDLPVVFVIYGAGWGHQVGMCQVGAAGLADKGWDYRRILEKYYQGCVVVKRY